MKRFHHDWEWAGIVLAGILLRQTLEIPLPVIMLAAFCSCWAICEADNRLFDQELDKMAREIKERNNA